MSEVWVFGLNGSLGVHGQESNQQSTCVTMQTVDLSGKKLLCSEHMHTDVLMLCGHADHSLLEEGSASVLHHLCQRILGPHKTYFH